MIHKCQTTFIEVMISEAIQAPLQLLIIPAGNLRFLVEIDVSWQTAK